jgi:NAD(P)-dependent dehydrogenase (short-subunit alcohol dehydrogenase family)
MPVALITGASAGLGKALATALARRSWTLIIDARTPDRLYRAADELAALTDVNAIAGDVSTQGHREQLAAAVAELGRLDLLVNNASMLGPSPLEPLAKLDLAEFTQILQVNVTAALALVQLTLPTLIASAGSVINLSSDAAVEHYEGWGGYGSAKAALDHVTATLAVENPGIRCYAIDPGDMRTEMHQAAFPGEDISDRPAPDSVVPALLQLINSKPPSGRYRAAEFAQHEGITL